LFRLHELKKPEQSLTSNVNQPHNNQNQLNHQNNGENQDEVDDEDVIDELTITTLMEVMNFTRDQAMTVLQEYGGDLNLVFQSLMP